MVLKLFFILVCLLLPWPAQADKDSRTTPLVRAVQESEPSIVSIATLRQDASPRFMSTGDPLLDEFFNNMFPPRRSQRGSLGTGLVLDGERGIIVTNSHVVRGASEIKIKLSDRREFPARLLGADSDNDIAVLQVDSQLPQARLGDSDEVMIGEQVLAVGNPYGYSHTVTVGVVSALHRRVMSGPDQYLSDLLQTDASINPGNSGGPLLNIDGEIIGINTMIHRSAQGIGFAIPINKVARVARILSRPRELPPVWLGMVLEDSEAKDAPQEFSLSIKQLSYNGPSGLAGLQTGDAVLAINGWAMHSLADYSLILKELQAGQSIELRVYRPGKGEFEQRLTAVLLGVEQARELFRLRTGLSIGQNPQAGGGFKVEKVELANSGIRPGDVVMTIGQNTLQTSDDLLAAMKEEQASGQIEVMLRRGSLLRGLAF